MVVVELPALVTANRYVETLGKKEEGGNNECWRNATEMVIDVAALIKIQNPLV